MLRDHPEIRSLFGPNRWSILIIVATLALQFSLAYGLRGQAWWVIVAVAWIVGAFANHAMYVMIHEASHGGIFRRSGADKLIAILADTVNVAPAAISFSSYHLKHHTYQGVYELDADLPSRWEARLIGSGPMLKLLWFALFPVFEILRPLRLREIQFLSRWVLLNWIVVLSVDAAVATFWGPKALAYLFCSWFFSIGLHPLGARWIQEHYLMVDSQETYSYYGPLNLPTLNVGYHNEHHDFPAVAWNRLPRLKRIASEYYDGLQSHSSWTRLFLRFVADRNLSHFSRRVRLRESRSAPTLGVDGARDADASSARQDR